MPTVKKKVGKTKPSAPKAVKKAVENNTVTGDGSKEDLLVELRNIIAEHGKLTRSLHETHGRYTEHTVKKHLGSYGAAKHLLGLVDITEVKLNRMRSKDEVASATYKDFTDQRANLYNIYQAPPKKRFPTMLVGSDMHDFMCDTFYRRCFIEAARITQPDVICLNGDIFDLYELSSFIKESKWVMLKDSLQWGHDLFKDLREASPNSQIDLIEGNHELRLLKRMSEIPYVRDLIGDWLGLSVSSIFKLEDYQVNYIGANSLVVPDRKTYPRSTEERASKFYWDCLLADHHPNGKNEGTPGFNGHHHRYISTPLYNRTYGAYNWVQTGGGHVKKATYTPSAIKWDNSFLTIAVDTQKKYVTFNNHDVSDICMIHGTTLTRNKDEEN